MKFKKAHATLSNVIHELVTSDKYYCTETMRFLPDCKTEPPSAKQYMINCMADVLSLKVLNNTKDFTVDPASLWLLSDENPYFVNRNETKRVVNASTIAATKRGLDIQCLRSGKIVGADMITTDGIAYYQGGFSDHHFEFTDENGFDITYKFFCIDIDGIPNNVTLTDCVNECPFGYGIRADGKILTGARADVWLEKGFQKGKNDN